jgi:hypothetical protein
VNPRTNHLIARCLGAALASILVVASVLIVAPANAKVPRAPHRYSASIEGLAGYSPQSKCSPWAKPGTTAFANMLLRTYRNSRSLGIVRSCGVGGSSEHKEGRAFDWGVSAYNAQDRRSVNSLMRWLLQKDRHGNRYAMARRLGIQYMIWNRRIWGSYSASSGWRRYTGSSPHTDHVHFSLSWKGARKKTSFWKPKRFGQPTPPPPRPEPKPKPEPKPEPKPKPKPKPDQEERTKPLPEPKPREAMEAGPDLVEEDVWLPASRRWGAMTEGALQQGHDYRVEVSGSYRYDNRRNAFADAECSNARGSRWKRDRSLRPRNDADADHLDVYLNGQDLYAWTSNGDDCDAESHRYAWEFQADRDGRVPLRIWDPKSHKDNRGGLNVRIVDLDAPPAPPSEPTPDPEPQPAPGSVETVTVDSANAQGARTKGVYPAGTDLRLTVRGAYLLRGGSDWLYADAECTLGNDREWASNRLSGWFDGSYQPLGDVAVNGIIGEWWPQDGRGSCDEHWDRSGDNEYTRDLTTARRGRVSFVVADEDYSDNQGRLTVKVEVR